MMDSMTGVKEAADAADWRMETMGAWLGLLKQEGGKGVNGVNKWSDFRSLNFFYSRAETTADGNFGKNSLLKLEQLIGRHLDPTPVSSAVSGSGGGSDAPALGRPPLSEAIVLSQTAAGRLRLLGAVCKQYRIQDPVLSK